MDTGKIFIVNLSKGKMGEDNSALLGAMIISRLQLAAMSRVDIPEEHRRDFYMYVDEFQNFATDSFASILSEARKYRLSLTLAHQYIGQLVTNDGNTKVRDAVFGNVGTIITFRVGAADGEFLEKEFMPEFLQNDLVNLSKANIYIKLMIDGVSSKPFSATTLPPHIQPLQSYKDIIIKNTREHYAVPRKIVDERIASEWNTNSETAINDKLGRRDERPLSQMLRPGGTSAASSAGRVGSALPRDRYMPPRASSGPSSIAPRAASSPSPVQTPSEPPRITPRPAPESISTPTTAARRETPVARHVAPISTPTPTTQDSTSKPSSTEPARAETINERTKEPLTSTAKEIIADAAASPEIPDSSPATTTTHTAAPKQFVRPKVDIEELRRSINESLKKQSEEKSVSAVAAAPASAAKPTQINTEPPGARAAK